jgi:hypothetical protein
MLTKEALDFIFAFGLGARVEFAEVLKDLVGFEVDALDLVIEAAPFDSGPLDDAGRTSQFGFGTGDGDGLQA